MAILTKAALRTAIDSVFASGQNITAEAARGAFHDWIDSLLDAPSVVAGSGISVSRNAGVVTVATGGAAAAVGIPSYVAASAAQPSDDVLTATITGLTASPPFPSLVYLLTPNDLDRAADDLELRINGDVSRVRALVDFRGDPLKARDLDYGALYEILATFAPSQQYRMTEPVLQRLQDFDIILAWHETVIDGGFTINDVNAASAGMFGTNILTIPPAPAASSQTIGGQLYGYLLLGVPADSPPVAVVRGDSVLGGQPQIQFESSTVSLPVGGVAHTWYQTTETLRLSAWPGAELEVEFGPYA